MTTGAILRPAAALRTVMVYLPFSNSRGMARRVLTFSSQGRNSTVCLSRPAHFQRLAFVYADGPFTSP